MTCRPTAPLENRRPVAIAAVVLVMVLAGCSVGYHPGDDPAAPPAPAEPPLDDDLGQYDGYWYNESLDVDATDGLTAEEERAVFSRAMARVQVLRGLPFEDRVEVELVTREEFREQYGAETLAEPPESARTLDNAQYEALFLVDGDEDVLDVRRANQGETVLGFYEPPAERIVVVSGQEPATLDDEITLAHELVHALQDQQFGLAEVRDDGTLDGANARNGLVEGDAVVVERAYERNCETGEWECVEVAGGHETPGVGPEFHFGVYFAEFFPYAEGPRFVEHHRGADGSWDAVDDMFADPPTATAEVISPETYGTDAYGTATVEDRSDDGWERVTTDAGPDHATVGQAGLASMLAYTAFEGDGPGVVDPDEFRNLDDAGQLDTMRPFTYDLRYTDGWYGDRLYAYGDGDDLASVWNVTFRDDESAETFVDGYEQVIEHWGGERAGTAGDGAIWTLDASEEFDGAVWVDRDGNAVTVVRTPSERDLWDVHGPVGG